MERLHQSFILTTDLVLVMLLRLRQVCCHPCLIQEGGAALVETSVLDEDATYDKQEELNRAAALVSVDFVEKMRKKFMEIAMERIEAEKTVSCHATRLFHTLH